MRQAYRKENVDVSKTYLGLFDFVPLNEWNSKKSVTSCKDRHEKLLDALCDSNVNLSLIQPVEREYVSANYNDIKKYHDDYVADGI